VAWSEALHPRGAGGEFSKAAAAFRRRRVVATELSGSRTPSSPVKLRRSESAALARYNRLTDRARRVNSLHARYSAGETLPFRDRIQLEYASPKAIAEARQRTGSIIRPKRETMRIEMSLARLVGRTDPRQGTKRTMSGKAVAVRGYGAEYTDRTGAVRLSSRLRNRAGKAVRNLAGRHRRAAGT
jgi:hypothetical protein